MGVVNKTHAHYAVVVVAAWRLPKRALSRSSADLEESETTDSSQVDSDDATSLLVSARRHLRFLRESDLLRQIHP